MAAIYHFKLYRAILVGFQRQRKAGAILVCQDGCIGLLEAGQDHTEVPPCLHMGLGDHVLDVEVDGGPIHRNDVAGHILDLKLVREARQREPDFCAAKQV